MENIEIKVRIHNSKGIRDLLNTLECRYVGVDHQIDTYFKMKKGRFKLRESALSGSHLIFYIRDNLPGPKSSVYQIIAVEDEAELKALLNKMLGIHAVIEKTREIYLYKNVRIHLDEVKKLGNFLEFEAVMDEKHENRNVEIKKINSLFSKLDLKDDHLITGSYENLIELPDNDD